MPCRRTRLRCPEEGIPSRTALTRRMRGRACSSTARRRKRPWCTARRRISLARTRASGSDGAGESDGTAGRAEREILHHLGSGGIRGVAAAGVAEMVRGMETRGAAEAGPRKGENDAGTERDRAVCGGRDEPEAERAGAAALSGGARDAGESGGERGQHVPDGAGVPRVGRGTGSAGESAGGWRAAIAAGLRRDLCE